MGAKLFCAARWLLTHPTEDRRDAACVLRQSRCPHQTSIRNLYTYMVFLVAKERIELHFTYALISLNDGV